MIQMYLDWAHENGWHANASQKKMVKVCLGIDDQGRKTMAEHPPLNVHPVRMQLKMLTGRDHGLPKVKDPETGNMVYPRIEGQEPDPAYVRMLAAHRDVAGPKAELVLSEKWIREHMCGCMSKRESAKCADKKLFSFKEMLMKYHELTALRHSGDCTSCNCDAATRSFAKAFGRNGVDAAMEARCTTPTYTMQTITMHSHNDFDDVRPLQCCCWEPVVSTLC